MTGPTVDSLLISKGLLLLGLVPLDDESVTKRQCRGRVGCAMACQFRLHHVRQHDTHASSQLNSDRASVVSTCLTTSASNWSLLVKPFAAWDVISGLNLWSSLNMTYKLLPCSPLTLRNTGFHALDFCGPKPSDSPLVFWPRDPWSDWALKVAHRRRGGKLAFASRRTGRHLDQYPSSLRWYHSSFPTLRPYCSVVYRVSRSCGWNTSPL